MTLRWLRPDDVLARFASKEALTDEQTIARDWLRAHVDEIESVALEARVGQRRVDRVAAAGAGDALARLVSLCRCDLVVDWCGRLEVVEVKAHARLAAVGQVQRYIDLLMEDEWLPTRPRPRVICRTADGGVDHALRVAGGWLEIVPAAA